MAKQQAHPGQIQTTQQPPIAVGMHMLRPPHRSPAGVIHELDVRIDVLNTNLEDAFRRWRRGLSPSRRPTHDCCPSLIAPTTLHTLT